MSSSFRDWRRHGNHKRCMFDQHSFDKFGYSLSYAPGCRRFSLKLMRVVNQRRALKPSETHAQRQGRKGMAVYIGKRWLRKPSSTRAYHSTNLKTLRRHHGWRQVSLGAPENPALVNGLMFGIAVPANADNQRLINHPSSYKTFSLFEDTTSISKIGWVDVHSPCEVFWNRTGPLSFPIRLMWRFN